MGVLLLENQSSLYYELISGDEGRPVLVFLHEGLGSVGQWHDFPEQLCRRTGCPGLVYDRLGHGGSSPLQAPRTIAYLHDCALVELPQVLASLIPGQRFILVGHSDGGSISLIFAAEKPPLLLGVVAVAAHVFVEQCSIDGIKKAMAAYDQGKLRRALVRRHGEKTEALFRAWADTWTSPWFADWDIEGLLPSIQAPVLALQGRDDQYGTTAQVEAIVGNSGGPATPLLLEDCGHAPHLEFPALTLDLVSCFVNRVSR